MRTLAALVFIAGCAAIAIWLAHKPTIALGRVLETEILALLRDQGAVGIACDEAVPIGVQGAAFSCTVTLDAAQTQLLACEIDRSGRMTVVPAGPPQPPGVRPFHPRDPKAPPAEKPASRDPWAN